MSHKGKSLHCASGHVRMSEDHPASVHMGQAMHLECHFTENPNTKFIELEHLFVAKALRMKYPKVPSGAPEYCMPHGTCM